MALARALIRWDRERIDAFELLRERVRETERKSEREKRERGKGHPREALERHFSHFARQRRYIADHENLMALSPAIPNIF